MKTLYFKTNEKLKNYGFGFEFETSDENNCQINLEYVLMHIQATNLKELEKITKEKTINVICYYSITYDDDNEEIYDNVLGYEIIQ